MAHLCARAVLIASCDLVRICSRCPDGIYLKHFLDSAQICAGSFLAFIALSRGYRSRAFASTCWDLLHLRHPPYSKRLDQVRSWLDTLLYVPHHVVSLICCMLAFLLVWMSRNENEPQSAQRASSLIAAALASAFGLSVYVAFAFFLVMLAWALWQIAPSSANCYPPILLAAGGAGASILSVCLSCESWLTRPPGIDGGSVFSFAIRDMIPPDWLMASNFLTNLATHPPCSGAQLVRFVSARPGSCLELGFYFGNPSHLPCSRAARTESRSPAERSLVFIVVSHSSPIISFVRSSESCNSNDFGSESAPSSHNFSLLLSRRR